MHRQFRFAVATAAILAATSANAERLYGLTFDNRIVTFDSADPETILTSRAIEGLPQGQSLVGIDVRPATNGLYSMTSSGELFELQLSGSSYTAVSRGVLTTPLSGSTYGFDFNPVPDRLRIISDTGQNLRVNPDNGLTIIDGMVTIGGPVALTAAAYTNSVAGALTTTLYAIDTVTDRLVRSSNPNAGTYVTTNLAGDPFGALGFGFTTANALGFDISGRTGTAFVNIDSLLWTVDLTTGAGTSLGVVGSGPLRSISAGAVPEPATWAMLITGFGLVGAAMRRRETRRLAPTAG